MEKASKTNILAIAAVVVAAAVLVLRRIDPGKVAAVQGVVENDHAGGRETL